MARVIVERPSLRIVEDGGVVRVDAPTTTLDAIHDAHARIDSPHIPRTKRDRDGLVLECDARAELGAVLAEIGKRGPIAYGEAVAFNEFLMDAVEAGHRAGFVLGALAWSSILVGASGRLYLFGFGLPSSARPNTMMPGGSVAPEVVFGMPVTETSDAFVIHALAGTLLPFASLPESYRGALTERGRTSVLHEKLIALSQNILSPDPLRRPANVAALRATYREIRPLVPGMPEADANAMHARLRGALATLLPRTLLLVDRAKRHLTIDGALVDLSRRALLWRLIERLLQAHRDATAVSADELVDAGWPDEAINVSSARTRLYTAIRDLRKSGIGDRLESRDGGYFLSPDLEIETR